MNIVDLTKKYEKFEDELKDIEFIVKDKFPDKLGEFKGRLNDYFEKYNVNTEHFMEEMRKYVGGFYDEYNKKYNNLKKSNVL